ncbi:glycosyltransferase family 2 protein [Lachnospira multipara]|uniref:Glycosyltransferase, GT2 family n=1 Tax=Lachnospira multipara TaxID=28051 RepID=A0A1H5WSA6_9FIRM|nr:glycosyltransferase [Lachnospira multipara]SEG02284.1 Glycosyltransferase, GT2 family [Lachnospira multipara]
MLSNGIKIIKNEGLRTFGHVLKEKLAERKDDNYRYWQIIKTTEKSIKDSYKDVTELEVDLIDLTNIRELSRLRERVADIKTDLVCFVDDRFYLESDCLNVVTAVLESLKRTGKDVDVFYADEDYVDKKNNRYNPDFKADFSFDTLLSYNYVGEFWCAKKDKILNCIDELEENDLINIENPSLIKYKMLILMALSDGKFYHINRCLMHKKEEIRYNQAFYEDAAAFIKKMWSGAACEESDSEESDCKESACKESDCKDINYKDIDCKEFRKLEIRTDKLESPVYGHEAVNHIFYNTANEKVSIIIPSKDNPELVNKCLSAIKKYTYVSNYEIVLVDNGSSEENKAKIENLIKEFIKDSGVNVKYIFDKKGFNFAYMCNLGAKNAEGEYLLFLNDDVEIIENILPQNQDWLSVLTGFASQKNTGSVGVKLLYPDKKHIQHVGIVNYEEAGFAHVFAREDDEKPLGHLRNRADMDCLCVTAACVLVSTNKFWQVGGFNEDLVVTHNDVELGLKLYEEGYNNVLVNSVKLIHHESLTRGSDGEDEKKSRRNMLERELTYKLHPKLKKRDPFYSPYLSQMEFDERVNYAPVYDEELSEANEIDSCDFIYSDEGIKAEITSVVVEDKLRIRGYAYYECDEWSAGSDISLNKDFIEKKGLKKARKANRKGLEVSYILKGEDIVYELKGNNKCDRMAHQRFNLASHCNYAENYCNATLAEIKAGTYEVKMLYKGRIVAKVDEIVVG